ncbi:MAG TPA: hypothetical protein VII02_09970, partial [Gemmatimonadaceae bacterium]
ISGDSTAGGAAQSATSNITSVIQTVLAAQLVAGSGILQPPESSRDKMDPARENGRDSAPAAKLPPSSPPSPPAKTGFR